MVKRILICLLAFVLVGEGKTYAGKNSLTEKYAAYNSVYNLTIKHCRTGIWVRLYDAAMGFVWCESPYIYRMVRKVELGTMHYENLESLSISQKDNSISIRAALGGLELNHIFELPADKPFMEERITLRNCSDSLISLTDFEAGLQRLVANKVGNVLPDFTGDRLLAIPFRHRANDPYGYINDFAINEFVTRAGYEMRIFDVVRHGNLPSRHRFSEGWAWVHGDHVLGLFAFNQENMNFSVVSTQNMPEGVSLRFGGACMISGEPAALSRIAPGQTVDLGVMRYLTLKGDYTKALYAFREMLDEKGCRFPSDYNPPVHWNELYDNPEADGVSTPGHPDAARASIRAHSYSKALIEEEARKAKDYSCEALYLDPGWDTRFGSFIWGEEWLGLQKQFVREMKSNYGLDISLHCPLATWMSHPKYSWDKSSFNDWSKESVRMTADGKVIEGSVCLGSKQYLKEAEQRLLKCCEDGAAFIMLDGNQWNDGCWNPDHGHPVPYRFEDHIRACLGLAQQIHDKYPHVLIEMHDMISGGSRHRMTPVYYKYGLPGSYDENWGFELMWAPFDDLKEGRGLALYYYNMGCNIPIYLHIDLRTDNEHCFVLWWFASMCRHLGIGGTHPNPMIAGNQKASMRKYRSLERYYKRGEFFGISEEIHLHVLPEENAFVINIFNLSDKSRVIKGSIPVERLGIDPNRWYIRNGYVGKFDPKTGLFSVKWKLQPWSTELAEFRAAPSNK